MASTTKATAAVEARKVTDGVGHLEGFPAYFEDHVMVYDEHGRHRSGAPIAAVLGATERRKAAVCELLGIDGAEYDRRAEAFVARLLGRHADLAGLEGARAHALAFASHAALAQARAKAAPAPAEAPAPAPLVAAEMAEAPAAEPRPVPKAARVAGSRGVRKVGVDPARAAAARRAALVRDVERVRAHVEAALFRAGRLEAPAPEAPAADAA
ncbi:MAG TPA: hypothetical protein VFS43_13285 [Polyangiaceae bacterium]|nr:hypothetical protein [Polyangiaceae bacterium]